MRNIPSSPSCSFTIYIAVLGWNYTLIQLGNINQHHSLQQDFTLFFNVYTQYTHTHNNATRNWAKLIIHNTKYTIYIRTLHMFYDKTLKLVYKMIHGLMLFHCTYILFGAHNTHHFTNETEWDFHVLFWLEIRKSLLILILTRSTKEIQQSRWWGFTLFRFFACANFPTIHSSCCVQKGKHDLAAKEKKNHPSNFLPVIKF